MHSPAPIARAGLALLVGTAVALLAQPCLALDAQAPGLAASTSLAAPDVAAPQVPDASLPGLPGSADVTALAEGALRAPVPLRLDAASPLSLVSLGPKAHAQGTQAAPEQDHPSLATQAAAPATVAGLAAVGVLALKFEPLRRGLFLLAAPLYSRLKRSQLLDNEVRARIHRSIEAEPGLSIIQVCRAAKVGWGTAVYHLQRLERDQMIVSRRDGQYRRFFLNGHAPALAAPAPAERVLQAEVARRIAGFVAQHPGCAQKDVCAGLGISPPLASKWLGRLQEAGLVTSEREWKLVHYAPTPALLAGHAPRAAGPALGAAQPA